MLFALGFSVVVIFVVLVTGRGREFLPPGGTDLAPYDVP